MTGQSQSLSLQLYLLLAHLFQASVSATTTAGVSRIFLDPSFDLSRPETFEAIFQLSASAGENFAEQVERSGRMIQERLSQQLDAVEVSITNQIAQKSHHFFQVCFKTQIVRRFIRGSYLLILFSGYDLPRCSYDPTAKACGDRQSLEI